MKRFFFIFSLILVFNQIVTTDLEARNGGKGGGGGKAGGGGARAAGGGGGARSVQRSPSMSRATSAPSSMPASRPQVSRSVVSGPKPAVNTQRPAANVARPAANTSRANVNTATRGQVHQFMQSNPVTRSSQASTSRLGQQQSIGRTGNITGTATNLGKQLGTNRNAQNVRNSQNIGKNIRDNVGQYQPNRGNWFNNNFWDNHHTHPSYYGNTGNWWGVATATGVGAWLGWQNQPNYYGYSGDYWGPTDSYDESPPSYTSYNPTDYMQQPQTFDIAPAQAANDEWMPLGVFAMTQNNESVATPNVYIQLAVSKEGSISGTYYNTTLDQSTGLEGLVDPATQRAAWKTDNDNSPIFETGIYNLTQPEALVRVYFPNGYVQDSLLVRLQQP